jgi:hypothetical protein
MAKVQLRAVTERFGTHLAVSDVNFDDREVGSRRATSGGAFPQGFGLRGTAPEIARVGFFKADNKWAALFPTIVLDAVQRRRSVSRIEIMGWPMLERANPRLSSQESGNPKLCLSYENTFH